MAYERTATHRAAMSALKRARHVEQPCSIDGCGGVADARGWCRKHYTRWQRHGDPLVRNPSVAERPPVSGSDHPSWKGSDITYNGAHMRVRRARGEAADHACVDCGGQAAEWSFNHSTPAERTIVGGDADGPYSGDIADWEPRCISCHRLYDFNR